MQKLSWLWVGAFAVTTAFSSTGCLFLGGDDDGISTDDDGDIPDPNEDSAEYEALRKELDENRQEFLNETADEHRAAGKRIYWLEFETFDPTVHSFDVTTQEAVDYDFSIGGDTYNFEASEDVLVTAIPSGENVVFEAYAADMPADMLDTIEVPGPTDEQRWWAYAVDGFDVYYVTTGDSTDLWKWTPGSDPAYVLTLEDTGADVGIFLAFGVENDRMMFLESGRAWVLDFTTNESTFLGHETEVQGAVSFDETGAFIETATGPFYYEFASGELTDIATRLQLSGYSINESFESSHLYQEQGVLHDGVIDYIGNSGLFRYDLAAREVEPLLLEPLSAEIRIEYRQPQVTSDGSVFVVGLTSESGSVGADGPLYVVR